MQTLFDKPSVIWILIASRFNFPGRNVSQELCTKLNSISITCLLASKGLLWVGTNVGCLLSLPLPRLEGVPQVKSRPNICAHAHNGPVRFLVAMDSCLRPQSLNIGEDDRTLSGKVEQPCETGDSMRQAGERESSPESVSSVSSDTQNDGAGTSSDVMLVKNRWMSTPELLSMEGQCNALLRDLYGSLMRGLDDESVWDTDVKGKKKKLPQVMLSGLSHKVSKISGAMTRMMSVESPTPGKYSTLPLLPENMVAKVGVIGKDAEMNGKLCGNSKVKSTTDSEPQSSQSMADTDTSQSGSVNDRKTPLVVDLNLPSGSSAASYPAERDRGPTVYQGISKSLVVASGGEGHINWSDGSEKSMAAKLDDICVLLWQCQN